MGLNLIKPGEEPPEPGVSVSVVTMYPREDFDVDELKKAHRVGELVAKRFNTNAVQLLLTIRPGEDDDLYVS